MYKYNTTFLLKNSFWYFAVDAIGKGMLFVLLPVYTSYLSPIDYGIVALCLTVDSAITIFSSFGIDLFASRLLFRFRDKRELLGTLLGNIYYTTLLLAFSTSLIVSLFPDLVRKPFFADSELPTAAIIFFPIWTAFFRKVSHSLFGYQKTCLMGKQYFKINLIQLVSLHSMKVIALVFLGYGVVGFLAAELITIALVAVVSGFVLYRMVRPRISFNKMSIIRQSFFYGLPSVPSAISGWVTQYIDRIILLKLMDMWSVGIYTFAVSITSQLFHFVWGPFRSGINPEFFKRLEKKFI